MKFPDIFDHFPQVENLAIDNQGTQGIEVGSGMPMGRGGDPGLWTSNATSAGVLSTERPIFKRGENGPGEYSLAIDLSGRGKDLEKTRTSLNLAVHELLAIIAPDSSPYVTFNAAIIRRGISARGQQTTDLELTTDGVHLPIDAVGPAQMSIPLSHRNRIKYAPEISAADVVRVIDEAIWTARIARVWEQGILRGLGLNKKF